MGGHHRRHGLATWQGLLLVVVILGVAIAIFFRPGSNQGAATGQYFYDLGSGALFVVGADALPPLTAPSGDEGVLAVVYSCSGCEDAATHQIAYLQKYTDDYLQQRTGGQPPKMGAEVEGTMIRAADGERWFVSSSDQVIKLTSQMSSACAGGDAVLCLPQHVHAAK